MILSYLILAHLLGDFVFQPGKLVTWKLRSKWGILIHVLIHFALNLIILAPFLLNGYYWLILVAFSLCFAHFWIDQIKINYDFKHNKKTSSFLIDQLIHLLAILLVFFFTQNISLILPDSQFYRLYGDIRLITLVAFLILASTVIEIYRFQWEREKKENATLKIHPREMLIRAIIVILIYGLFMILSFYARGNHGF